MNKIEILAFCSLAMLSSEAVSGLLMKARQTSTCSFMFENDLFGTTDRYYTNGVMAGCISRDVTEYAAINPYADWLDRTIQKIPYLKIGQGSLRKSLTVGASVGQKIYTPQDITQTQLITTDRPYAGWLYFGTSLYARDRYHMDTAELVLGVVGPAALGEQAQNGVHKLRDIPQAQGWDNQLHNELGVMLVLERRHKTRSHSLWGDLKYDAITHYGGAVGNVYTYVNGGAEVRMGWRIPKDFGTSLIRPGGNVNGPGAGDQRLRGGLSMFGFGAVSGRYVVRNIFLDGNTFTDSHHVDKTPWVTDLVYGAGLTWSAYKLTFSRVQRSKEFKGQQKSHIFGSLTLSISF